MSFSSGLNPDVVKTELDDVFMQVFSPELQPGYVDANSELILRQLTTDKAAEQEMIFKGVSLWDEREEEQDVASDIPEVDNKITFNIAAYAKQVKIPKHFFDDNMHNVYAKMVRDFAIKGKTTQDKNALGLYVGGFATHTTADGSYLFADDHTTISGDTVDNKGTAALSESALNTGMTALVEQKDQSGVVLGGNQVKTLLVPPALFKTACEIVDSELQSGTGNNNINIYSSRYGISVATSAQLGATASGTTGADAYWYLIGTNASPIRWVRKGIETDLVDYKYTSNNTYVYKAEYREAVGAPDYVGVWGSTGA